MMMVVVVIMLLMILKNMDDDDDDDVDAAAADDDDNADDDDDDDMPFCGFGVAGRSRVARASAPCALSCLHKATAPEVGGKACTPRVVGVEQNSWCRRHG